MEKKLDRDSAFEILDSSGVAKEDYVSDEQNFAHNTVLDYMTRAVMRYPSDEAKNLITRTKQKLQLFFENYSDEEIEWVFAHGKESRGFFTNYLDEKNNTYKNQKYGLLVWLNQETDNNTSSQDISLINGIIASISYAAFDKQTNYQKVDSENNLLSTHDCRDIKSKCMSLMSHAPYAGAYLPERNQAIIKENGKEKRLKQSQSVSELHLQSVIAAPRRLVSKASISENNPYFSAMPEMAATRRLFDLNTSYASLAANRNRLVGHYSANTTSAMFILNELFKLGSQSEGNDDCVLSENDAKIIAGMIAAEYHRSGFHAPEEVYLGLQPYLEKLKLQRFLSKHEFEQYLEKAIPKLLPKSETDFIKLTKNAIEMLGNASELEVKQAILFIAQEVADNPDMQMPEKEPILLINQKKNNADAFKKFKEECNKVTSEEENEKKPNNGFTKFCS